MSGAGRSQGRSAFWDVCSGPAVLAVTGLDASRTADHTHAVSKRLQVLLDDTELREIQQLARRRRVTVAEWVRQALRAAKRREPRDDMKRKLEMVRAASTHAFPSGSIEDMLGDIEKGYADRAGP